MRFVPRSLFARLLLIQGAYGLVVGLLLLVLLGPAHTRFHLAAHQSQARSWAAAILSRHESVLLEALSSNSASAAAAQLFESFRQANASADFYLVDAGGSIRFASVETDSRQPMAVDLAPVRRLIAGQQRLPILMRDPAAPDTLRAFSAAQFGRSTAPSAYLIMVLHTPALSFGLPAFPSYLEALATGTALAAPAFAAVVLVLFAVLTPLRKVSHLVESLRKDKLHGPAAAEPRKPAWLIDRFELVVQRICEAIQRMVDNDRKARDMFAHISHDLRTPLSVLDGCLETAQLRLTSVPPQSADGPLATAAAHTRSLTLLADRIFELAELSDPEYLLLCETFSLTEAVRNASQNFSERAISNGTTLHVECEEPACFVRADAFLIERVLDNLIDNAIKHARAHTITLALVRAEATVTVLIRDDGVGLPAEVRARLTYSPVGEDRPLSSGRRLGIGLRIVRRILELHGSDVELLATMSGTALSFELPMLADRCPTCATR